MQTRAGALGFCMKSSPQSSGQRFVVTQAQLAQAAVDDMGLKTVQLKLR
jgi:hypothetical protein